MSIRSVSPKVPITAESNLPVKTCGSKMCDLFNRFLSPKIIPAKEDLETSKYPPMQSYRSYQLQRQLEGKEPMDVGYIAEMRVLNEDVGYG